MNSLIEIQNQIYLKFFNVDFWDRERERDREWMGERQRERGRHRIQSRLQAPSSKLAAQSLMRAETRKPWDHDLSWSQVLNQPNHSGASKSRIWFKRQTKVGDGGDKGEERYCVWPPVEGPSHWPSHDRMGMMDTNAAFRYGRMGWLGLTQCLLTTLERFMPTVSMYSPHLFPLIYW